MKDLESSLTLSSQENIFYGEKCSKGVTFQKFTSDFYRRGKVSHKPYENLSYYCSKCREPVFIFRGVRYHFYEVLFTKSKTETTPLPTSERWIRCYLFSFFFPNEKPTQSDLPWGQPAPAGLPGVRSSSLQTLNLLSGLWS